MTTQIKIAKSPHGIKTGMANVKNFKYSFEKKRTNADAWFVSVFN